MKISLLLLIMLGSISASASQSARYELFRPHIQNIADAENTSDETGQNADEGEWIAFIDEDFSKITNGSEDAPGPGYNMNVPSDWTKLSNWVCGDARPAGGCVYLGEYSNVSYPGKGFISTPKMDMSSGGGRVRVSFRARLTQMPEGQEEQTPEKDLRNVNLSFRTYNTPLQKQSFQLTTEWQTYHVTFENADFQSNISFYGHNVLIDDIKAEGFIKSLPSPLNPTYTDLTSTGFTASWDKVNDSDVSGYLISLFTLDNETRNYVAEDLKTEKNSYTFTGLDMEEIYYFTVKSTDGNRTSVESSQTQVFGMFNAPEIKQPSDVTRDGFTANWGSLKNAEGYMLSTYILHNAPEEEFYPILDENFDNVGAQFSVAGYLDNILNRAQWYAYYLSCQEEGYLTFDNAMNFIMPGTLISPRFDIPAEKPTVKIRFKIKAENISAVQLSLGNGDYLSNTFTLNQTDEANKMIVPTSEWEEHEYILTGTLGKFSQIIFQAKGGDGSFSIDDLKVEVAMNQNQQIIIPKNAISTQESFANVHTQDCFYGDIVAYDVFGYTRNQKGEFVTSPASQLMPVITTYPERPDDNSHGVGVNDISKDKTDIKIYGTDVYATGSLHVYNMSGTLVGEGINHVTLSSKGVYIISTANGTVKVAVY